MVPPNGLAFSCRERARQCLQKPNDLAREAVSCNAGLGGNAVYSINMRYVYGSPGFCYDSKTHRYDPRTQS